MTHASIALGALFAGYLLPLWAFPYACLALIVFMVAVCWANALELGGND